MSKGLKRGEEKVGQETVETSARDGAEQHVRNEESQVEEKVDVHPYKKYFGKDVFIRLNDTVYPAKVVGYSHLMEAHNRPYPASGQKHGTRRNPVAKLVVFDIAGSGRTFPKNGIGFGTDNEQFHDNLDLMEAACGYDKYIAPVFND